MIFGILLIWTLKGGLTVCVTCAGAGVDSVWEQRKLEARKRLVKRAESHTSAAHRALAVCE